MRKQSSGVITRERDPRLKLPCHSPNKAECFHLIPTITVLVAAAAGYKKTSTPVAFQTAPAHAPC